MAKINITRGENKVFTIRAKDKNGDAFDLTNFDQVKVCLPLEGDSKLEVTEVANANGSVAEIQTPLSDGKIQVTLNYVDSETLKVADGQNIGVILNNAATPNPKPQNGEGVLNVKPNPCA